jgi:hypothetical protein
LAFAPRAINSDSHFFVIAVLEWQYLAISFGTIGSTDYRLRLAIKSKPELPTSTLAFLSVPLITGVAKLLKGTKLAFTVVGGLARRSEGLLLCRDVSSKRNLNRVKMLSDGGNRAGLSSAISGNWSRLRQCASTRSERQDMQIERYLVAVCSLMLMVALVAGAAGYAGICSLLSVSTATAKAEPLEQVSRKPAQILYRYGVTVMPNSQYAMPRNTSSFIGCK